MGARASERAATARIAALLLLAALGAAADLPRGDGRLAPIPGSDLSILVPAGWSRVAATGGAVLLLRGPALPAPETDEAPTAAATAARERARPMVAVSIADMPADATQAGMAYDALKHLERLLARFDPVYESAEIAGRTWQLLSYTFEFAQLPWRQELYMTSSKRVMVYVACSSPPEVFEGNRAVFRAMVEAVGGSRPKLGD